LTQATPRRTRPYRGFLAYALVAAVAYVPLLFTARGKVGADTKTYLYLDPARLLSRAVSMWDPNVGLGTVTHQTIGYLWPMGPFYWFFQELGVPDWLAQRIWLGSILFAAGAGVLFLLRQFGWSRLAATVAAFAYFLTPYTLTLAARISVILLPFAGLPWLIAFAVRALRRGGWRDPALFALVVMTIGGVNATALVFAGVAPLLWFVFELLNGDPRFRAVAGTVGRIGVLTAVTSLWWLAGLWAQGKYGIDILAYTETAKVVAAASLAPEVLRGLGYWFFYGGDRLGPWIEPGKDYTQRLWLIAVTYITPVLALFGGVMARWRERAYFALLVFAGVFISVGAYPWGHPPATGALWKRLLLSDAGLALRSTPRAVPLSALGLAVLLGAGFAAIARWSARAARPLGAGLLVLCALGQLPLFTARMVASNLERPEDIPSYWTQMAAHLDAAPHDRRILEIPGTDFASYRWGNTVDPITPGLVDRPYVARELIPYGSPPSSDLLNALDRRIQEHVLDPAALVPIARFMAAGDVVARLDLQYERYRTPRPYVLWPYLTTVPGLGAPYTAGPVGVNKASAAAPLEDELALATEAGVTYPPVADFPVEDARPIVRAAPNAGVVIVAGDGEGLVELASAGLLTGDELVRYSASLDAPGSDATIEPMMPLVVTDSNRKRGRRWSTVRDNVGYTEQAGEKPLITDLTDNRLPVFPDESSDSQTVAVDLGGVHAQASGYGNPISFTPEYRPEAAVDGNRATDWRVGASADVRGERLRLTFDDSVTTDHITALQMVNGFVNRHITNLDLVFDAGTPSESTVPVTLDPSSWTTEHGQVLSFPSRTFSSLDLVIRGDDAGHRVRWNGLSQVGFTEVDVDGRHADEVIRVPTDLLTRTGAASLQNALTFAFERARMDPAETVREDEELALARMFTLPTDRTFALAGTAHVSDKVSDATVDDLLDGPQTVIATSSRRLPGDLDARASRAIDGDPSTWWSPGFDVAGEDWLQYDLAAPITFDHLDVRAVADGRHSVPTHIRIEADGAVAASVDVPAIADDPTANHVSAPVHLTFPAVTGHTIRFVFDGVRDVTTTDWFSNALIRMPLGIAELGAPGLSMPARSTSAAAAASKGCRSDLLTVDDTPVSVALRPAGGDDPAAFDLAACASSAGGLTLAAGDHILRSAPGTETGIDVNSLQMQSAPGGAAPAAVSGFDPMAGTDAAAPAVTVHGSTRTSYDLTLERPGGAAAWLVLGQSLNDGWRASADGHDLGPPQLVNGYANGWLLPAGAAGVDVTLTWKPQRVVYAAELLSLLGALVCIGLALWPRRRPSPATALADDVPAPFDWRSFWWGTGDAPSIGATVAATTIAFAAGAAVIGLVAGALTAISMVLALRVRSARGLVALAGPFSLGLSGLYILARQAHGRPTSAFEWPAEQSAVHQVGWMAVAFLLVTVAADRMRRRRRGG
jgi:arabinofuranan 3-O-arabinosyltransferase